MLLDDTKNHWYKKILSLRVFSRSRQHNHPMDFVIGANMSGKYSGMQEIILKINKYAMYILCAGHSLNLLGRAAVDCCLDAVNIFGFAYCISLNITLG